MRNLKTKKSLWLTMSIIALGLSSCNAGKNNSSNNSSTGSTIGATTARWTQISGGTYQPKSVGTTIGSSTPGAIVIFDESGVLWTYNGESWSNITGNIQPDLGVGYPFSNQMKPVLVKAQAAAVAMLSTKAAATRFACLGTVKYKLSYMNNSCYPYSIFGNPTPTSIVLLDYNGLPWVYDGNNWSQTLILNRLVSNIGGNISQVFGNPTPSSMFITFDSNDNLFYYDGKSLNQLTGVNNDQPQDVLQVYGNPTPSSIVMLDNSSTLWTYNGQSWESIVGSGATTTPDSIQPQDVSQVYGNPTPSSIVMLDNSSTLWTYNGQSWESIAGGDLNMVKEAVANPDIATLQPQGVWQVYGNPSPSSIVMLDNSSTLWTYNGQSWESLSGGGDQPLNVLSVIGSPTTNSIVLFDNNRTLWTYNGSWSEPSINKYPIVYGVIGGVYYLNRISYAQEFMVAPYLDSLLGVPAMQAGQGFGVAPYTADVIFGVPNPNSIFMVDNNKQMWSYDGSNWSQLSGSAGEPQDVQYVSGMPSQGSIVVVDMANRLWIYSSK